MRQSGSAQGFGPDVVVLGYPAGPDSAFKAVYDCGTNGDNGSYTWGLASTDADPVALVGRWAPLPAR